MGLNIHEARVFSNIDAYSLDVSWCMDGLLKYSSKWYYFYCHSFKLYINSKLLILYFGFLLRFLNNKLLILLKVHLWTHIWINSLFSYFMFEHYTKHLSQYRNYKYLPLENFVAMYGYSPSILKNENKKWSHVNFIV